MAIRNENAESHRYLSEADAFAVARVCSIGGLLGESEAMRAMFEQMARAAHMHTDVLITGESGSGKELAARCLHDLSPRAVHPFLVLNAAALPATLVDAELFGRDSDAAHFPGHAGLLERAGSGTVLLEDVGELSQDVQRKLLRALESRRYVQVGGNREQEFRARILVTLHNETAATTALLPELRDRLLICHVRVPALRERGEDVALLAHYFLEVLNAEEGTMRRLSPESLRCLMSYSWPGNVRELRNAVHRAFILAEGDLNLSEVIDPPQSLSPRGDSECLSISVGTPLAEVERRMIMATLRKCEGNKTRAAALLGVSLKTLYNRLNAYRAQARGAADRDQDPIEVAN